MLFQGRFVNEALKKSQLNCIISYPCWQQSDMHDSCNLLHQAQYACHTFKHAALAFVFTLLSMQCMSRTWVPTILTASAHASNYTNGHYTLQIHCMHKNGRTPQPQQTKDSENFVASSACMHESTSALSSVHACSVTCMTSMICKYGRQSRSMTWGT